VVPPGSNVPPPHSHPGNEELVYVLEGTLRYTVGSVTRDLRPGESMGTPRGVVHGFSNPHRTAARALVVNTPDIGAGYFREVAVIAGAGGPPDRTKLIETMRRYGLVLAAPPPQTSRP
jgi:mannose-6-phosphate isomerase-like protein (cupin superfamily)